MNADMITSDLTHRLEAADAREAVDGLRGLAHSLGDEQSVIVRSFGRITAVLCKQLNTSLYNRVIGFDSDGVEHLDEIIKLYREHDKPCRIDIVSEGLTPDTREALTSRGLFINRHPVFSTSMVCREAGVMNGELPDGVCVQEVNGTEAQLLGRVHEQGLSYPPPLRTLLGRQLAGRLEAQNTRGFLAMVDGQPAGTGLLTIVDGIGYLGHASTKPEHRGRGAQTALIRARVNRATQMGCDHLVTFTVPGSSSERNTSRCGFEKVHTIEVWMDVDVDWE